MPLKMNIGLSRKVGEPSYGSRGASVNLEMELESALISEPDKLKERIRQLFALVRASLADELNGNGHSAPPTANGNGSHTNGQANGQSNGSADAGQRSPPVRPATQSQVKAIIAIARSQKLDLQRILHNRYQISRPDDLSLKEASSLIDDLKAEQRQGG